MIKVDKVRIVRDSTAGTVTYQRERTVKALSVIFEDTVIIDESGNRALAHGKLVSTEALKRGDYLATKDLFERESVYVIKGIKRGHIGLFQYTIMEYDTTNQVDST